ncbi:GntR family transcriptional regulator [Mycolicibacterium litorale]|uniref:GntR family transcriptional regulator n=1 Tax=Mycolicibacterium litorale TaxID=758802 RepID=A0AAD1IPC3_9MYCO|nr:GntR family transcriptional regulator [Mycolicibacterium litorale]MCV7417397.1 GntR family transcriptional regulator [Mycolicibacterium litorale]TDY05186.1 GntR family transcriptional regulator [Mycolicibacterium litorale]BBY18621.1 GntR family transcriptional regulator [Mycolicibacterium litorale]
MPKRYGVKEKDQVVAHVIDQVLTGRLRGGHRIDRNAIAAALGVSRVPIQEAMVQLEHDGIVSTRYHRGAFVERFDEVSLAEHHELYGVLNGIASARAAIAPSDALLGAVDDALQHMRKGKSRADFQDSCQRFRDVVNNACAGPRLRAAIHASQWFAASDFWLSYPRVRAEFLPTYQQEAAAIHDRDPVGARTACLERSDLMATIMIAELTRRGVLGGSGG